MSGGILHEGAKASVQGKGLSDGSPKSLEYIKGFSNIAIFMEQLLSTVCWIALRDVQLLQASDAEAQVFYLSIISNNQRRRVCSRWS